MSEIVAGSRNVSCRRVYELGQRVPVGRPMRCAAVGGDGDGGGGGGGGGFDLNRLFGGQRLGFNRDGDDVGGGSGYQDSETGEMGRTRVFGGWLDTDVVKPPTRPPTPGISGASSSESGTDTPTQASVPPAHMADLAEWRRERAEEAFVEGVDCMNKGMYEKASQSMSRASDLVGGNTRQGGEYQLWLAQSLDAQGRNVRAQEVLGRLKHHDDRDVRKVAKELLFILRAPRLHLGRESFVQMDVEAILRETARKLPGWRSRQRWYRGGASTGVASGRFRPLPEKREVEKYSLEWYVDQAAAQRQKRDDSAGSMNSAVVPAAALILLLLWLVQQHGS